MSESRPLAASAEEIDYLLHRFEIRDYVDLFSWATKLLHDLSKAEEAGWLLALRKGVADRDTGDVAIDPRYDCPIFPLDALAPTQDGFTRFDVASLEKHCRVDGGEVA